MENLFDIIAEAQKVAFDLGEPSMITSFVEQTSINSSSSEPKDSDPEPAKPKNWKKPKDMPKRPLSAYNLFFKSERQRIVSSVTKGKPMPKNRRGKSLGIGFAGMARNIAGKWKIIPSADKTVFEEEARIEKVRYRKEIAVWRSKQALKKGPSTKKTPTEAKPALSFPSTVVSVNPSTTFDTSYAVMEQSLHSFMQETLMRGRDQFQNQMDSGMVNTVDPVPFLSLSSTRNMLLNSSAQAGSRIVHPFDLTSSEDYPQSRRLSLFESIFQEESIVQDSIVQEEPIIQEESIFQEVDSNNTLYTQEAVPLSCWRALASTLNEDPFFAPPSMDRLQETNDDLSHFMDTMEEGFW